MTRWHFRRRAAEQPRGARRSIDASLIRRDWMSTKSEIEINAVNLTVDGLAVPLGEVFELTIEPFAQDQIIVEGDLRDVHGLGTAHDRGEFRIVGSVGHNLGSAMTGGTLSIDGDAGDFVGAPLGSHKVGMAGGVIRINGNAGRYAGHRMRRGTLLINGSAGPMLAASAVAGTICVGGEVGEHLAVGMKRGTIVLAHASALVRQADAQRGGSKARFSQPMRFDPTFLSLYHDPLFIDLTRTLRQLPVFRTRADRSVGGLGEVIFPASAELALEGN